MKAIVLPAILALAGIALAFAPAQKKSAPLFNTKWLLTRVKTADKMINITDKHPFILFDSVNNTANGNGGCNRFGGKFEKNGDHIQLGPLFSTKMYCAAMQGIEDNFMQQLATVDRYNIQGNKLVLYRQDTLILEFVAN